MKCDMMSDCLVGVVDSPPREIPYPNRVFDVHKRKNNIGERQRILKHSKEK